MKQPKLMEENSIEKPTRWTEIELKEMRDIIMENVDVHSGTKILDIGCGLGDFLGSFKHVDAEKVGIDIEDEYIDHCRIHHPECTFEVADACDLPFPDESFNVVIAICCIEHVDNPSALVREAFRVTKPGGQAIFITPNLGRFRRVIMAMNQKRRIESVQHKQGWDYHMLYHLLETYGWTVKKIVSRFVDFPFHRLAPKLGHYLSYGVLLRMYPWCGSELFAICEKEA